MFKLQFSTNGKAFDYANSPEVVRVLRHLASAIVRRNIQQTPTSEAICDAAGNKIGSWSLNERG